MMVCKILSKRRNNGVYEIVRLKLLGMISESQKLETLNIESRKNLAFIFGLILEFLSLESV